MSAITRPLKFSDPNFDFTQEELNAILSKRDDELGDYEFMCIFQSNIPAGTYEECLYFVSVVLNYVEHSISYADTEGNEIAPDVLNGFFCWYENHWEQLSKENNYQTITQQLIRILEKILSNFVLYQKKTGKESSCILVRYANLVEEFMLGISIYKSLKFLESPLKKKLSDCNSLVTASWLITLCLYPIDGIFTKEMRVYKLWNYKEKSNALGVIFSYLKKDDSLHQLYWEKELSCFILSIIGNVRKDVLRVNPSMKELIWFLDKGKSPPNSSDE